MSFEDFQLRDIEAIDSSAIKRDFLKNYNQQAANLNDFDQNVEFIFRQNENYHQIGNAYLQYKIRVEKDVANAADRILVDADIIRLMSNAFAYCFKEARLSTTSGSDIEHNKYVGQVSKITGAKMEILYLIVIKLMNLKLKSKIHYLNIFFLVIMMLLQRNEK